jgi:integrase
MCEEFRTAGDGRKVSPGYRRTLHSYLRQTLRVIGAPYQCFAGFPGLKPVRPRETVVSDADFEATFTQASPWLQLTMLLARDAGLRHATIMNITRANCNFENRTVTGRSKAYSSYNVPMTNRLETRLRIACQQANDDNEPLLNQWNRQRKRMHYNTLTSALVRAKRAARIEAQWGFHDLRRTGARKLYEQTRDIRKVQRFLGHATPAQSFWYLGNAGVDLEPIEMEAITTRTVKEKTA